MARKPRRIKITPKPDGTFIAESDAQDVAQQPSAPGAPAAAMPPSAMPPAVPGVPPVPVQPWNPFEPRPNDDEPAVAAVWLRKLSKVISSVKYMQMPVEWRAILNEKYFSVRQALTPPPMPTEPGKPAPAGGDGAQPQAPRTAKAPGTPPQPQMR